MGLGSDAGCESLNFLRHDCYNDAYLMWLGESDIRKHLPHYMTYNTPPINGVFISLGRSQHQCNKICCLPQFIFFGIPHSLEPFVVILEPTEEGKWRKEKQDLFLQQKLSWDDLQTGILYRLSREGTVLNTFEVSFSFRSQSFSMTAKKALYKVRFVGFFKVIRDLVKVSIVLYFGLGSTLSQLLHALRSFLY